MDLVMKGLMGAIVPFVLVGLRVPVWSSGVHCLFGNTVIIYSQCVSKPVPFLPRDARSASAV